MKFEQMIVGLEPTIEESSGKEYMTVVSQAVLPVELFSELARIRRPGSKWRMTVEVVPDAP